MTKLIKALATAFVATLSVAATAQENAPQQDKPTVYMVAGAHMDTQWRWDVRQTIGEFIPNTLLQNFRLFEEYPDYIFNFEGAVKYSWVKEYYPQWYEQLKEYIHQGRWHVSGSSWDANDPNMPSAEAAIRNIMYGQNFYKTEFGVQSHDVMLPDCFGFGYALPTIAAHCGLNSFHTQKLQWRTNAFYPDGRKFPFRFGIWQGIDGSRIMACLDGGDYFWNPSNEDLTDFGDFKDRIATSPVPAVYRYFGTRSSRYHGDQGGSPTPQAVGMISDAIRNPKAYNLRFATTEDMFADYYMDSRLPEYDGELLMDVHATGCYSSHSEMKKNNRANEWLLTCAENSGVMAERLGAMNYPAYTINEGWKKLIVHQFHDDLTGTSIPAAYMISYNDEYVIRNQAENLVKAAITRSASALDTKVQGTPVVVFNPVTAQNPDPVKVTLPFPSSYDGVAVTDPSGKTVNAQIVGRDGDNATVEFAASDASMAISVYSVKPVKKAGASAVLNAGKGFIENRIYKVTIDGNGDIPSIIDKRTGRELVKEGDVLGFALFGHNVSDNWPAWEILKSVIDGTPSGINGNVKVSIDENGPLRVVARIEKSAGKSKFVQRIILTDGAADDRILFENDVDWHSEESLLKYSFPLNLTASEASYDMGVGNVRRGSNVATQYEVFAHQWADMTADDASFGVTVMNDSKYGWDKPDNHTLRLTLHHTPTANGYDTWQHTMDFGHHTYSFAICAHEGALDPVKADIDADCLNRAKFAYVAEKHAGTAGKAMSFISSSEPSLRVKAFKKALDGDGIVVRTYELGGHGAEGDIVFDSDILSAEELNGAEEYKGAALFDGKRLHVKAGAFEPKTYRVRLKDAQTQVEASKYESIALPYNEMAITSDAFSAFGHMDNDWHSYAGELIPSDFEFAGVPFSIAAPDYNNAVRCHGQALNVPAGTGKVYLLVASAAGARTAVFNAGKPVEVKVGDYTGYYGYYGWEGYYESVTGEGDIAYMGTHRHDSRKRNEIYTGTYMYIVEVPVQNGASKLVLPDDDQTVVFAATSEIK